MREWFALRRASRRLAQQSTTEAARPTRFEVYCNQVARAHAHRARGLGVGYPPKEKTQDVDTKCDMHILPEMTYLEHLRVRAPIHETILSALLASLVRLKTLDIGYDCRERTTPDFSALRALERLDLDDEPLTLPMAQTLPASLRSLSGRVGYGLHAPIDAFLYLRNLTALCLTQLEPECAPCVAAIAAHMPHLGELTLHVMSNLGTRAFANTRNRDALGPIADRQLMAFTALHRLRRLTVLGNLASHGGFAAPATPFVSSLTLALLCSMPALERLDLARLTVHCLCEQSVAYEKTKFASAARACRSVDGPVWQAA
jgi:hypothetical protein